MPYVYYLKFFKTEKNIKDPSEFNNICHIKVNKVGIIKILEAEKTRKLKEKDVSKIIKLYKKVTAIDRTKTALQDLLVIKFFKAKFTKKIIAISNNGKIKIG